MKNIKRIFILVILSFSTLYQFGQNGMNLSLIGTYEWTNTEGSDIWGWADPNGNEYALVGLNDGFSVVNISISNYNSP